MYVTLRLVTMQMCEVSLNDLEQKFWAEQEKVKRVDYNAAAPTHV